MTAKYQTIREFERKRDLHTEVYTGSLNPELHLVLNQTTEYSTM